MRNEGVERRRGLLAAIPFDSGDLFADEAFGDLDDNVADGAVAHAFDDPTRDLLDDLLAQRRLVRRRRWHNLPLLSCQQCGERFSQRGRR